MRFRKHAPFVASVLGVFFMISFPLSAKSAEDPEVASAMAIGAAIYESEQMPGTDPIKARFLACGNNLTGAQYDKCGDDASAAYDKVLNVVYRQAMKKADPDTRASLRDAQRKWVAFMEADGDSRHDYAQAQGGTIWSNLYQSYCIELYRDRIAQLMVYNGVNFPGN